MNTILPQNEQNVISAPKGTKCNFWMYFSAFSTFAFAEYFVAAANMGYYWTLVGDLPDEEIIVKKPCHSPTNLQNGHPNNTSTPSRNKKEN